MKNKEQLKELFNTVDGKFYILNLPEGENPYQKATNHISGNLQVMQADDRLYYACGEMDSAGDSFATEIGE